MDLNDHELDYLYQAHWHNFQFRLGRMDGLNRTNKQIHLAPTVDEDGREVIPARSVNYDTLVMAVGSTTNDFGTAGAAEHAIALDNPQQAALFHSRLLNACLRANAQREPLQPGQLHIAIIGAGATGVELAAELHNTIREFVSFGLDRINPERDIKITIVEAAPKILPALPERLSVAVLGLLKKLKVEVLTGEKVTEVSVQGVRTANGRDQGAGFSQGSRWAGNEPHQPVGGDADASGHARCKRVRFRRLRELPVAGEECMDSAACPIRASAGHAPVQDASQAAARRNASAFRLPRLRLAGFAGQVQHSGQPDGCDHARQRHGRGLFRQDHVPVALQDARIGVARIYQGLPRHAGADHHAAYRASHQAALVS
jgi:hypothetical protein